MCIRDRKAIYEVVAKPFYWDKTQHGIFDAAEEGAIAAPDAPAALICQSAPNFGSDSIYVVSSC